MYLDCSGWFGTRIPRSTMVRYGPRVCDSRIGAAQQWSPSRRLPWPPSTPWCSREPRHRMEQPLPTQSYSHTLKWQQHIYIHTYILHIYICVYVIYICDIALLLLYYYTANIPIIRYLDPGRAAARRWDLRNGFPGELRVASEDFWPPSQRMSQWSKSGYLDGKHTTSYWKWPLK